MNKIFFYIFLLCPCLVISQNKGIEVTYKTISNYDISQLDKDPSIDSFKLEYAKRLKANYEEMTYVLKASKQESIFETIDQLQIGYNDNSIAKIEKNQKHYVNDDEYIFQTNFQGQDLLIIENSFSQDWKIVDEEIEILGFNCKKAILTYTEADQEFNISAWFAPAINYNYGPKGFHGLPGLILKIERNDVLIYEATELKEKKNLLITVPYRGKKITREEFDKRMLDIINMMKQ